MNVTDEMVDRFAAVYYGGGVPHLMNDIRYALRAALSAAPEPVTVPDGWQLVPKEPTSEMIEAGLRARMNIAGGYGGRSSWEAMLSSAPTPPGIRETTE